MDTRFTLIVALCLLMVVNSFKSYFRPKCLRPWSTEEIQIHKRDRSATGLYMSMDGVSDELQALGNDIEILPPSAGKGMRTVMKFGGSSLANAERIMYVSKLIRKHCELGYRPIIVCSAMGKTTNSLLSAGDFALDGSIFIDSLRTLHMTTIKQLGLPSSTAVQIEE